MEEFLTYVVRYDEINAVFLASVAHEPHFQTYGDTAVQALEELLLLLETMREL